MAEPDRPLLERYQPWRRAAEVGFWTLVLGLQAGFNSVVRWMDRRGEPGFAFWQPAVWELSSVIVMAALIPAVLAFERRFPLRWDTLARHLPLHLGATVAFSVAHVAGMVALRHAAYALADQVYTSRPWPSLLAYEYLKDVRSYLLILLAVWSYRLLLLRLQGEARVLDAPEPPAGAPPAPAPAAPQRPERFLVRKLRREFLIAAAEIEWVQAQGNYVGLHVAGHDYLLRSTLADFLAQLDPARFVRVHRSYAVNLDRIAEIEPLDSGDAKLRMKNGGTVPCSRRYREALAQPLSGRA